MDNEEIILGELDQIHTIVEKKEEFACVREKLMKQYGEKVEPEVQDWHKRFIYAYKRYYCKTKRSDLVLLYKMMHLIGNQEVVDGKIPEGAFVNVWTDRGFLYQFCFYKEYTLMLSMNPFDKTDYEIVNEEQGRSMDLSIVKIHSWMQKDVIRIGKPETYYKRFGLTCKDCHFGTINGD